MPTKTMHIHFWDYEKDPDNPVEELELPLVDEYPDYYQFGGTHQGQYLEIRIFKGEFESEDGDVHMHVK